MLLIQIFFYYNELLLVLCFIVNDVNTQQKGHVSSSHKNTHAFKNGKLVYITITKTGSITCFRSTPVRIFVINFLCIKFRLRSKRLCFYF